MGVIHASAVDRRQRLEAQSYTLDPWQGAVTKDTATINDATASGCSDVDSIASPPLTVDPMPLPLSARRRIEAMEEESLRKGMLPMMTKGARAVERRNFNAELSQFGPHASTRRESGSGRHPCAPIAPRVTAAVSRSRTGLVSDLQLDAATVLRVSVSSEPTRQPRPRFVVQQASVASDIGSGQARFHGVVRGVTQGQQEGPWIDRIDDVNRAPRRAHERLQSTLDLAAAM